MLTLKNSEIHLWYADQADFNDEELESLILHWLTADEKNRYQRYYFDRQRNQFLLSRMVVRSVLSRYSSLPPSSWKFNESLY